MKPVSKLTGWSLLLIVFVVSFSCENEDNSNLIKMRVNHYVQPAIPDFTNGDKFYLVQQGHKIGSTEWLHFSEYFENFNYELGYTYDLLVEKEEWCRGCQDVSGYRYTVKKVISKTKAPENLSFELLLILQDYQSYVVADEASGFKTTNGITIQCGLLCDELEQKLAEPDAGVYVFGTFEHVNNTTLRLVSLRTQNVN